MTETTWAPPNTMPSNESDEGAAPDNFFANLPVPHFFRWLLLFIVWQLSTLLILPAVIWAAVILEKTGYRKIDLLSILFVPFYGLAVAIGTQWRYCAREQYWTVRADKVPMLAA